MLLLVTSTQRRGGEVFGEHLADGLTARDWDVRMRALVRSPGPSIDAMPLVDKDRSLLKSVDLEVIRSLRREVKDFKPDVVMANGGGTLPIAVAGLLLKRNTALVYGSIGEPLYWARTSIARRRLGFLLRDVD